MREGETVIAFANCLRLLLPEDATEDESLFQFMLLDKLPAEAKTQSVLEAFEARKSFEELVDVSARAQQFCLSERGSKRPRAQVNAVQEEEEQVAVNWVNHSDNKQQKSKRARTGPRPNA